MIKELKESQNFKICKRCGKIKLITEFSKIGKGAKKRTNICKDCYSKFQITPIRVYSRLKSRLKHRNYRGEKNTKKLEIMTLEEFLEWDNYPNRKCYYCDLPEKFLWTVKEITKKRYLNVARKIRDSKRLHLDRKDNKKGYIINNVAWACPICNIIKRRFFKEDEWKEIAQKFIKPLWQKEISKKLKNKK